MAILPVEKVGEDPHGTLGEDVAGRRAILLSMATSVEHLISERASTYMTLEARFRRKWGLNNP
jgi:hypothetical protein